MLEKYMEELIARFPDEFFRGRELTLTGRQQSFAEVGRFDLLFKDHYSTNVLMELKAHTAKYEDASQLAKYKDALEAKGVENILMWLVATQIPNSVREFLDRFGIEYSEIHEAQFRRVAERHGIPSTNPPVQEPAETMKRQEVRTRASSGSFKTHDYELNTAFNRQNLIELIKAFEGAVKRRSDVSLSTKLKRELVDSEAPIISKDTMQQLSKWCNTTNPLYFDGMEVARKISQLLFGRVLDRERLGV